MHMAAVGLQYITWLCEVCASLGCGMYRFADPLFLLNNSSGRENWQPLNCLLELRVADAQRARTTCLSANCVTVLCHRFSGVVPFYLPHRISHNYYIGE